jgi:hypothetical protein
MTQENSNGFTIKTLAEQIAHLTEVIAAGQQAEAAWRDEERHWREEEKRWREEDRRWKQEDQLWKESFRTDLDRREAITERQAESVDRLSRVAEMLIQELRQKA